MTLQNNLSQHLLKRPLELSTLKQKGSKIVGYNIGDFVPEELIYAAGAIPVCQIHGGEPDSVDAAHSVIPRHICPFARAQIGHRWLKEQPYYELVDMLIIAISCKHLKKAADVWNYFTDVPIHRVGLPPSNQFDHDRLYFIDSLQRMREALEKLTGNQITEEKLRRAIALYNRMRKLLQEINLKRQTNPGCMSSLDFIKLNHASYLLDPETMVKELQEICSRLEKAEIQASAHKIRLFLVAPNVAYGDYNLFKSVSAAGAEICGEQICEGVRTYTTNVEENEDNPMEALAEKYLANREVPCAFSINSLLPRFEKIVRKAKELKADGVLFYQLRLCETYDIESVYFAKHLKEHNLPMLKIESEYEISNQQQNKTRIEAFLETLERRGQ